MALKPLVKPRFATDDLNNGPLGGPNVQEPSEAKKNTGWNSGEKPPREYFNWLHRLTYQWIDWLDEVASDALLKSNNLSDLPSPTTARTNLGLGTAAVANTGTSASNVPTITDADGRYARRSNNLSDLTNITTARSNLGLGTAAVANTGTLSSNVPTISDADARYVVKQQDNFTPTLSGSTVAGAATYTTRTGKYSILGNVVYFTLEVGWSAHTGTGNFIITGLPVSAVSRSAFAVYHSSLAVGAGKQFVAEVTGGTTINLWASDPSGGNISGVPVDSLGTIVISGMYFI